jgi:hypothetical protein
MKSSVADIAEASFVADITEASQEASQEAPAVSKSTKVKLIIQEVGN